MLGSKRFRGSSDELVKAYAMMWTLTLITLSITAGKSSSDESLLKRFIQHLFQLPFIQSKITEQMSTAATVAANAVTKNNSDSGEETVSAQTATSLSQPVETWNNIAGVVKTWNNIAGEIILLYQMFQ